MGLMEEMKERKDFTEREENICNYLLSHPEKIARMSSRELGNAAFSSAAAITRFCKKLGCKGYPDFKLQFLSELKLAEQEEYKGVVQIADHENIVSTIRKVTDIQMQAIEEARKRIELEQMVRIGEMLHKAEYVDFYAYDTNVYAAQYGCSQLFHSGKIATVYHATNMQVLNTLLKKENHIAIIISHTGESTRLIEIAKFLKQSVTKVIVITSGKDSTLARMGDETLYAKTSKSMEEFRAAMFFTSVKYLLDVMFSMEFSHRFDDNIKLNQNYENKGKNLWALKYEI